MTEQLDIFFASAMEEEKHESKTKFNKKTLTPRQWRLLDLIKVNSLVNRRKTTQKEICESIDGYEWNSDEKCHDHCPAIWSDIKDINLSYETDKLIISDKFEYWLGNEEETQDFIDKLWSDLAPRLTRYWAYLKKVERDGQGLLIDRKGKVIEEDSQARAFIESYGSQKISED